MRKNMKQQKELDINLRTAIEKMKLSPDDRIFLHKYKKDETKTLLIKELSEKELNSVVMIIQPKYGGKEYKHACYLFILK